MKTEFNVEQVAQYFEPDEFSKLQDCLFRAVDFVQKFFPHPDDQSRRVELTDSQIDAIDSVQFGFPIRKHKFSEVDHTPNGVVMTWPRQCLVGTTNVQLSDGTLKPIKEIENESVISYQDGFRKSNSVQKVDNGMKKCLCITTKNGREIKCTYNHPFLTSEEGIKNPKYIEAIDLSVNDKVAMVRKLPQIGKEILSDDKIKFIAYMIAEGCLSGNTPYFTNTTHEIVSDWKKIVENWHQHRSNGDLRCMYNCKNKKLQNLLKDISLDGTRSENKFIPDVIFKSTRRQIAIFLSKLIDCDGNVYKGSRKCAQIHYTSKSKQLIKDLVILFTRIGMYGNIYKYTNKGSDQYYWRIKFTSSEDIKNAKKFLNLTPYKQKILDSSKESGLSTSDVFPGWHKIKKFKEDNNLTCKFIKEESGYRFESNRVKSLTHSSVDKIKSSFPDININKDLYWDEIVSIKDIGEKQTYGLHVPEYHTHITNGFVTHNTGKSFACAYGASAFAIMMKNCDVGIVSASDDQSKKFMRKVKYIIKHSPFSNMINERTERQNFVELENGNHIQCWPCSDSIEGSTYKFLFADEAAKMDEDVLLESALPTVTHGDRWIMLSTPKGNKGKFIEYYRKGINSRPIICKECNTKFPQEAFNAEEWPLDELPTQNMHECPECGEFNYKYGVGLFTVPYVDPWNDGIRSKEWIKNVMDEHDWSPAAKQEYLGKVVSEGSLVFLKRWIQQCTNNNLRNVRKPQQSIDYVIGVDYGKKHDASSFYVTHKEDGKIILDYAMSVAGEFDEEREYYYIKKYLLKLIKVFNPMWIVPDATGLGDPLVETMETDIHKLKNRQPVEVYGLDGKKSTIKPPREPIRTDIYNNKQERKGSYGDPKSTKKGFIIDRTTKPGLIGNLIKLFQQDEIRIPPSDEPEIEKLRTELIRFESEWKPGTNYTAYGTQSFHDDRVIALALSAWGHRRKPWKLDKVKPVGGIYNSEVEMHGGGWNLGNNF